MFKWSTEYSIEADYPLRKVYDFIANPHNWPKWLKELDSCTFDDPIKTGSVITVTIKKRSAKFKMLITKLEPYKESSSLTKAPLFLQEASCIFQEISPNKTCVIFKINVKSILVPFLKSYFSKKQMMQKKSLLNALQEAHATGFFDEKS